MTHQEHIERTCCIFRTSGLIAHAMVAPYLREELRYTCFEAVLDRPELMPAGCMKMYGAASQVMLQIG